MVLAACSANSSNETVGSISNEAPKDPAARVLDAKSPVKVAMLLPLSGSPQTAAVAGRPVAGVALLEWARGVIDEVIDPPTAAAAPVKPTGSDS